MAMKDYLTMQDPRLLQAQQMIAEGTSTAPIQHWTQGLSRLANALAGNVLTNRVQGESTAANQAFIDAMQNGGGYDTAIKNLSAMPNNQYAGRLAQSLAIQKMEEDNAAQKAQAALLQKLQLEPMLAEARARATLPYDLQKAQAMAGINANRPLTPLQQQQSDKLARDEQQANIAQQEMIAGISKTLGAGRALEADTKGREAATGLSSFMGNIPTTKAYDFRAKLETFKAQNFLPAVSALKGMGALSDAEGKKLIDSVGALNPNMSEEAFLSSLKAINDDLQAKLERRGFNVNQPMQQTMQPQPMPQAQPMPQQINPAVQDFMKNLPAGTKYLGVK